MRQNPDTSLLEDEANDMAFASKAGGSGIKNQKRDEWHPGV